jgi:hypothetical protein
LVNIASVAAQRDVYGCQWSKEPFCSFLLPVLLSSSTESIFKVAFSLLPVVPVAIVLASINHHLK